jgi:hypothetical protein
MISQAFYDSILGWDWNQIRFYLLLIVALLLVVGVTLKAGDNMQLALVLLYFGMGAPGLRELILRFR